MSHWYHCNISNSLRFPLTVVFPRAAASVTVFISVSLSLVKTSPCPTLFRSVLWEYNFLKSLLCQLINITKTLQFSTKSNKKVDLEKIVIVLKIMYFSTYVHTEFSQTIYSLLHIFDANILDGSSIHFYGHWQTPSDGFKSQNIILAWPSRVLSKPARRVSHSRPHCSLLPPISRSLVGQQSANGRLTAGHVTRAPPPSGQGFPRSVVG